MPLFDPAPPPPGLERAACAEDLLLHCPKPLCVVGNAALRRDFGAVIDSYATVIRLNNFRLAGFAGLVGSKTDLRCVTGRGDVENRNEHVEFTPFTASAPESRGLADYNRRNRLPVIAAATDVRRLIRETAGPSTGFALVQLLAFLRVKVDLFGFDGFKTCRYWERPLAGTCAPARDELPLILRRRNVARINEFYSYAGQRSPR